MFASLGTILSAALRYTWAFWGRGKQQRPAGEWQYHGYLTGRGFGKTYANSSNLNEEIERGEYRSICLIAQDEDNAVGLLVSGPSGLMSTAPPWFRPAWDATRKILTWPNGARAYVRTPEVPDKIRGFEYDLSWCTEIQSWPKNRMMRAWADGVQTSTRIGKARIIWDATPKKRHPILKELLSDAETFPTTHFVVRGGTRENRANLAKGYVENLEKKFKGTSRGREELDGEMLDDAEAANFKSPWIDETRVPMPDVFARRGIGVDPAITSRKGSDTTGIVFGGLRHDGKAVITGNKSERYKAGDWAKLVVDEYIAGKYDVVVAETNKGGELIAQNIRTEARSRNWQVVILGKNEKPSHKHGIVYIRERYAKGAKQDRAQPVATAYERGNVAHVEPTDENGLASLEDTMTTWEADPNDDSPGDLDAMVHLVIELLDLTDDVPDAKRAFAGITQANAALNSGSRNRGIASDISRLLQGRARTI